MAFDMSDDGIEPGDRLEGVRVLIVDDDRDVAESMDVAFRAEGAQTRLTGDGNEAVRLCNSEHPELVILDMMLPGRSGFLALEKIKGREDSPLVVMVTANEGHRHEVYAKSMGVDGYLHKPVPLERLIELSAELVERRRSEDAASDQ